MKQPASNEKQPINQSLAFKVSVAEKKAIEQQAKELNLNRSQYLRIRVLERSTDHQSLLDELAALRQKNAQLEMERAEILNKKTFYQQECEVLKKREKQVTKQVENSKMQAATINSLQVEVKQLLKENELYIQQQADLKMIELNQKLGGQ